MYESLSFCAVPWSIDEPSGKTPQAASKETIKRHDDKAIRTGFESSTHVFFLESLCLIAERPGTSPD
jgi:hypothetical protein